MLPRLSFATRFAAASIAWYAVFVLLLGFRPFQPVDFGLVFNSMAEHLLRGQFDVDPDILGAEAFLVDGRAVAYFGIFCALLRIPAMAWPGFATTDFTAVSCFVATAIGAWAIARAIRPIWPTGSETDSRRAWLVPCLLATILLGGPTVQFLRPSIFQETVDWAFALAAWFVFLSVRGLTAPRGFDRRTLCALALCAGLALIARVSFGIGLYAALGFLLLARASPREWLAPGTILAGFAIATGIVNFGRWGDPSTFADYTRYALDQDVYPDRLGRLAAYGTFNPARIPLGIVYYFFPVWIWIRSDGHVLFAQAQSVLMDAMELPAGSFFATDPLLLALALTGVATVRDRSRAALLLGMAIPPVLMLCAISMAHRYRMEFYPFFLLAAAIGTGAPCWRRPATRRFRGTVLGLAAFGIAVSHAMGVLYAHAPWGPGEFFLERYGPIAMWLRDWA